MFTFFHRKPKVVFDCFTTNKMVYDYTPIVMGIRSYPDWWKALPNPRPVDVDIPMVQNMKKCFGFTELFKNSFMLSSWCDMHFRVTPNEGYRFSVSDGSLPQEHDKHQYTGGFNDYYHSKLLSPWHLREKTSIRCAWVAADYHHGTYSFKIVPGITQYRDNSSTNVNMMLYKQKQTYDFFIPIGMPLVHIVPLVEDKKIEVKCHFLTEAELTKVQNKPSIYSGFNSFLNLRRKQEDPKKSKCPFHFS